MTTPASVERCARAWEVEAVRDGRLRGHDAESLRRHLQSCSRCVLESERVASVGDDLRRLPAPYVDALAGRRIRQRLLMQHNAWLLRQDGAPRPRRHKLALVAASVLLVGGGFGLLRAERAAPASPEPNVEVLAAVNARWRRETEPHTVRVVLDQGELRLKIRRFQPTDRVSVVLPDGAIEDLGTVLDVRVLDGQTRAVQVEQGRVILRLHGEVPRTLAAGESWLRRLPTEAPANEPNTAADAPAPRDSTVMPAPSASWSPHRGPAKLAGVLHKDAGGHDDRGKNMHAEQPPNAKAALSEKAEDDAYLHIVDLLQRGRNDEARHAAKDYLLRFPNGFRRVEVLNIATHAAP